MQRPVADTLHVAPYDSMTCIAVGIQFGLLPTVIHLLATPGQNVRLKPN